MPSKLYGNFLKQALNKEIDWDSDTIKVALLSSSYTPNQDTHDYFDDVTSPQPMVTLQSHGIRQVSFESP